MDKEEYNCLPRSNEMVRIENLISEVMALKIENKELVRLLNVRTLYTELLKESEILKIEVERLRKENKELLETIGGIEKDVSKVYCHITDSKFSKPNTRAECVIDEADEFYKKLYGRQNNEI